MYRNQITAGMVRRLTQDEVCVEIKRDVIKFELRFGGVIQLRLRVWGSGDFIISVLLPTQHSTDSTRGN